MLLDPQRRSVAAAARALAASGLVLGTGGNVSERDGDRVAITPTGIDLAVVEAADVAIVDLEGTHVDGRLQASSELDLHLGVYRRYGAGAVVHTHAPIATAVSCVLDELPCIHYQLLLLGGTVRVAPYRTFGTPELAQVTLDALEGRTTALMANHGTVTFAPDAAAGVTQTELLEWGCELYWRASSMGTPRVLDEQDRQAVVEAAIARGYGTTKEAAS